MNHLHTSFALLAGMLIGAGALAHGGADHAQATKSRTVSTEEHAWGREGDPTRVNRTIVIDMTDRMRFAPDHITVKRHETVRFIVRNRGKLMHEIVIGTDVELKQHAELMKKHPGMEHEEPYMAHVNPGRKESLLWQFTQAGEFTFACLIPGHFEAGMQGRITVR